MTLAYIEPNACHRAMPHLAHLFDTTMGLGYGNPLSELSKGSVSIWPGLLMNEEIIPEHLSS
jgi:hypothetical protein